MRHDIKNHIGCIHAILPPLLNISDVDLCILLGNLLDNTLEACNRIEDLVARKFAYLELCVKKICYILKYQILLMVLFILINRIL
ncbi:MAG: GHKL domain-containing protein, partial [Cellulosilyticaceae bacterium]